MLLLFVTFSSHPLRIMHFCGERPSTISAAKKPIKGIQTSGSYPHGIRGSEQQDKSSVMWMVRFGH